MKSIVAAAARESADYCELQVQRMIKGSLRARKLRRIIPAFWLVFWVAAMAFVKRGTPLTAWAYCADVCSAFVVPILWWGIFTCHIAQCRKYRALYGEHKRTFLEIAERCEA